MDEEIASDARSERQLNEQGASFTNLPFLSGRLLESLSITTAEVIDSIEQLIFGQRCGKVWSAPKAVVLPGDERYIMTALAVADEPGVASRRSPWC